MTENNKLNDEQMKQVSGGRGETVVPTQHFFEGDRVMLLLYREYGVGTVIATKCVRDSKGPHWECTVQFDMGIMTADETEFIAA